ncbi:MAG: MFS transporter, partial [Acidimicrobiales bacterium]
MISVVALTVDSPSGRWVLVTTVLGSGIAFLDATAVNVALPRIGKDLGGGLADLQWTITAYALTLSAFLLLGGALGDRYGRRRVFQIGLAWFAAASLLCGVAASPVMLIAARALQGVGGALLTPGSLAIIEASFAPGERGRAIGTWSGFGGLFGAIGPFLGGLLAQSASWRLVFFINPPLAALAIWIAGRHVPESSRPGTRGRLDVPGPVFAAVGLGALTYALIEGASRGWGSTQIVTSFVVGGAALVAFFANEAKHPDPLLPLDIFRSRLFAGANGATFAIYGALGAVTFLVILQLQDVLRYSPLQAGLSLLPLTLILLTLSRQSGKLADRIGPRLPMTVGPLLAAAGMALYVRVHHGATYVDAMLPATVLFGLGMVLTVPALTTTAMGAVADERAGVASAINNDVARVASLSAVA